MIVPGGGISADGSRWIASRPDFLMHFKVLARLFRGKFLAMLATISPVAPPCASPQTHARHRKDF